MSWNTNIWLGRNGDSLRDGDISTITLYAQTHADSEAECREGMAEVKKLYDERHRWYRIQPDAIATETDFETKKVQWIGHQRLSYLNESGPAHKLNMDAGQVLHIGFGEKP